VAHGLPEFVFVRFFVKYILFKFCSPIDFPISRRDEIFLIRERPTVSYMVVRKSLSCGFSISEAGREGAVGLKFPLLNDEELEGPWMPGN
jgi:hypothetical protein